MLELKEEEGESKYIKGKPSLLVSGLVLNNITWKAITSREESKGLTIANANTNG